jgi:Na+-transporting methylmalonyl-CoA/oxaloacetate decarboxylase gamma subunit
MNGNYESEKKLAELSGKVTGLGVGLYFLFLGTLVFFATFASILKDRHNEIQNRVVKIETILEQKKETK